MHEIGIGRHGPAGAVHMGFGVIADSPEVTIVRQHFFEVKTSIANRMPYDEGVPPPAEQLGEPSRLFREPEKSSAVQESFVVKEAGTER